MFLYPGYFSVKHNWEAMTEAIQSHIGSLNWGYRVTLREKGVTYVNSFGEFVDLHKIKVRCGSAGFIVSSTVIEFGLAQKLKFPVVHYQLAWHTYSM